MTLNLQDNTICKLTRSSGVSYLSQYLQSTLTGYRTLKHPNHLSTYCLYRDSTKSFVHHDRKYCAIRGSSPGQLTAKLKEQETGWASPGFAKITV